MNDSIKARLEALGLTLPATEGESYYGAAYGTMKPFHATKAGSRSRSAEIAPRGSLTRRVISPRSNRHRQRVSTRAHFPSLALMGVSVALALSIGFPLGILSGVSGAMRLIVTPVLDAMQTMPAFVYLVPAIFFFGVGAPLRPCPRHVQLRTTPSTLPSPTGRVPWWCAESSRGS